MPFFPIVPLVSISAISKRTPFLGDMHVPTVDPIPFGALGLGHS